MTETTTKQSESAQEAILMPPVDVIEDVVPQPLLDTPIDLAPKPS